MNRFIRILYLLPFFLAAVSCGPSRYTMHLEMRYPSKAGVDLAGKIVSVVYLEDGNPLGDGFAESMSAGFASSIEKEYGTGEGSVGIYRMKLMPGGDYSSKDTLTNLLIDTGSDVVFLIDTVSFGEMSIGGMNRTSYSSSPDSSYITVGSIPVTVKLYCYDAMDRKDMVKNFAGTTVASPSVYSGPSPDEDAVRSMAFSALPSEGWYSGELVAASFESQWKVEGISIVYFDSAKWLSALQKADNFDWKGAMDIWLDLVSSKDVMKRASASYDLAAACYMLGDYELAKEWLDFSDKENKLPLSDGLRKRIEQRL